MAKRGPAIDWDTLAPKVLDSVRAGKPLGQSLEELGLRQQSFMKYRKRTPEYDAQIRAALGHMSNRGNTTGRGGFLKGQTGNPEGLTNVEREQRDRVRHKGLNSIDTILDAFARGNLADDTVDTIEELSEVRRFLKDEQDWPNYLKAVQAQERYVSAMSKFVPKESFRQQESTTKDITDPTTKFLSLPAEERAKLLEAARADLDEVARLRNQRAEAFREYATIDVEAREVN